MSKKFRGLTCVYCCKAPSSTRDHVFARQFFMEGNRSNLPQVPSCSACNVRKSELEHYAATVMPFGGQHDDAVDSLTKSVTRRLKKNQKLLRTLIAGRRDVWFQWSSKIAQLTMTLPVDGLRMVQLFELIGKGLAWHHWKHYLDSNYHIQVLFPTLNYEGALQSLFQLGSTNCVQNDLGNGTVHYHGVCDPINPGVSAWRISILGGIKFADEKTGRAISGGVCVLIAHHSRIDARSVSTSHPHASETQREAVLARVSLEA